jgi:hypothetical protein
VKQKPQRKINRYHTTFIKYSEYYTAQSSAENTEEIFNFRKETFVSTEDANNTEENRKNQEGNKVREQRKMESVNSPSTSGLQG